MRCFALITAAIMILAVRVSAATLEQLQNDPKMTPKRFARYFSDFDYEYHPEIQSPENFLRKRAGDCADYATLADKILRPRGYNTRLIYIGLSDSTAHTVCYIEQEKGYLDFNNRACLFKIEHCGASVEEIAAKVAKSFRADWAFASEFTYDRGRQHFSATVSKLNPPKAIFAFSKPGPQIKIFLTAD